MGFIRVGLVLSRRARHFSQFRYLKTPHSLQNNEAGPNITIGTHSSVIGRVLGFYGVA